MGALAALALASAGRSVLALDICAHLTGATAASALASTRRSELASSVRQRSRTQEVDAVVVIVVVVVVVIFEKGHL